MYKYFYEPQQNTFSVQLPLSVLSSTLTAHVSTIYEAINTIWWTRVFAAPGTEEIRIINR